jgi:excinuclease UvrABC nuclease subunit
MARKKRSDRNYLIYQIVCIPTGEEYFGITVTKVGGDTRTLKNRLQQHYYKATTYGFEWTLADRLRKHGKEAFAIAAIEKVRGKAEAYAMEAELINDHKPELNTKFRKK